MHTHLRVFPSLHEHEQFTETDSSEPAVRVRLGDLLPLMAMAQKMHFIWLKDFLDDEVIISQDFYDVMQAFQSNQPTSA